MRLLKSIALFIALVVLFLTVPILFTDKSPPVDQESATGLPWQIDVLPDGASRVFGITLGQTTFHEIRQHFGEEGKLALIVAPGESGSVEAYFEKIHAGFVSGRLLLTIQSSLAEREAMLQRAVKADYMDSTTKRITLSAGDIAAMEQSPIVGVSFIPAANLDEAIIQQRFGMPAERIRGSEHTEHFLYPNRGLDLILDRKGKEVLQYVAPKNFASLRDPLIAVAAARSP
jgi:hypothetical protein